MKIVSSLTTRIVTAALVVGGLLGVGLVATTATPAMASDDCTALNPFDAAWSANYLASIGNLHTAAAAIDLSSGCQFHLGATDVFPTASTVKPEIMGAVFLTLQDRGATSLPTDLAAQIDLMITQSDNTAAQTLYDWVGGGAALQTYGRRLGMVTTDNTDYGWGGDATTPEDQLLLLHTLLVGGGALGGSWVALARGYMTAIEPDQAWGVSAGVPAGSTIALKNGWLFNDGTMWGTPGLWRTNSIGAVTLPDGRTYLIAVYGDHWPTMETGVTDIETVSTRVASVFAAPRTGSPTALTTAQPASAPSAFTAVNSTRLLDTRTTGTKTAPGNDLVVAIPHTATLPSAVAVEITAVDTTGAGYVTAYADGTNRPLASNLNPLPGRVTANLAVVPVGADGDIRLAASVPMNLVVDLVGTWTPQAGPVAAGRFLPVTPTRVLDTRTTAATLPASGVARLRVTGQGQVPAKGVAAVAVTVTATDVTTAGYWTVWPGTGTQPLASTLNTSPGDTVGNTTLVPVAPDGTIAVYSQNGGDLVVDVDGWVTDATATPATTGKLSVLAAPVRLDDTRFGDGGQDRIPSAAVVMLTVGGRGGIPANATGFVGNLTTVDPDADAYLTAYPASAARPSTSTTNPTPDRDPWATAVVSGLGSNGGLGVYATTSIDVVLDAWGWFNP